MRPSGIRGEAWPLLLALHRAPSLGSSSLDKLRRTVYSAVMTTTKEREMPEQDLWDSEDRDSPYSTVADPNDEDYCEGCDQMVDYTTSDPHGTCGCSPVVPTTGWLVNGRPVL